MKEWSTVYLLCFVCLLNVSTSQAENESPHAKTETKESRFINTKKNYYWEYDVYASSPRYRAHAEGSQDLLNFSFVDWGYQGVHAYPGMDKALFTKVMSKSTIENKFGFVMDGNKIIGLSDKYWKKGRAEMVAVQECALCHVGKVAGQIIVGLGNKKYDAGYNGEQGTKNFLPSLLLKKRLSSKEYRKDFDEILKEGNEYSKHVVEKQNLTQGLVPIGVANSRLVREQGDDASFLPRAQAKVPAIWGYGPKRESGNGVFMDGFGDAKIAGWGAAFPISGGVDNDFVVKHVDRLEHIESAFAKILPPPYPFTIDKQKTERGKKIFTQNCARCHGKYERDSDGVPIFVAPKYIPFEVVGTDMGRPSLISPRMATYVKKSSLNPVMKLNQIPTGLFAPRLESIWARFPYLHNASVPSIYALLTPSERPEVFSLKDATELVGFDTYRLGLQVARPGNWEYVEQLKQAQKGARDIYYKKRDEHSNEGHEFGSSLTLDEKMDLIEYLKTI